MPSRQPRRAIATAVAEPEVARYTHHVFVCTHQRPVGGKPSCGRRGGVEIAAKLAERALRGSGPGSPAEWAVTECGCLGPCFDGPNLVVYPEGRFYAGLTPGDVDELVETELEGGRPVERLLHPWTEEPLGAR
jgi:(2Fe-2S) ferredoxin